MPFIRAYNTKTGDKLTYLVPEHWVDHPVLGRNLSRLPSDKRRQRRARKAVEAPAPASTTNTEAPAAGDNEGE